MSPLDSIALICKVSCIIVMHALHRLTKESHVCALGVDWLSPSWRFIRGKWRNIQRVSNRANLSASVVSQRRSRTPMRVIRDQGWRERSLPFTLSKFDLHMSNTESPPLLLLTFHCMVRVGVWTTFCGHCNISAIEKSEAISTHVVVGLCQLMGTLQFSRGIKRTVRVSRMQVNNIRLDRHDRESKK